MHDLFVCLFVVVVVLGGGDSVVHLTICFRDLKFRNCTHPPTHPTHPKKKSETGDSRPSEK